MLQLSIKCINVDESSSTVEQKNVTKNRHRGRAFLALAMIMLHNVFHEIRLLFRKNL